MRKFLVAIPIAVIAIGGSTACATKKFVRTSVGEVNDKVDSMGRVARTDPGASARRRGTNHRSRTKAARAARRPRRRRLATQAARRDSGQQRGDGGQRRGDRGGGQGRSGRQGDQAARVRGRAERGRGQLQVRQDRSARRGQGASWTSWSRRSRPIRRAPTSKSKGTRTTSAIRRPTSGSVSSVPKRSSGISTNSTRSRCSRST